MAKKAVGVIAAPWEFRGDKAPLDSRYVSCKTGLRRLSDVKTVC